jgi:redox-sensitive bicupin YhaK (pirin superfamily)
MKMKKVVRVHDAPGRHWVGDGFPVRSLFSYGDELGAGELSPFLLLDHAAPMNFEPSAQRRGVGEHPHRGFETVTIVYQGELEHRDSTGSGGRIGPGDVQWMTAGAGIVHEEFHSEAFGRTGGPMEMVQLWVNLPAKDKMTPPGYQTLLRQDIPVVDLPDGAGSLRVIAGEYAGQRGPARTFSAVDVWDLRLNRDGRARLTLPAGRTLALVMLRGTIEVNGSAIAREGQLVQFEREGSAFELEANNDAGVLLISGAPLDEPVVGYGPFVMNSRQEIITAIEDFNSGRFGAIPPLASADQRGVGT